MNLSSVVTPLGGPALCKNTNCPLHHREHKLGTWFSGGRQGCLYHNRELKYEVTFVFKTGEKSTYSGRGPKPIGYNVYENGWFKEFLPAEVKE